MKDRIIEFRRLPASELVPHPKNWRTHPQKQREALKGILDEIGYADTLLVRQLPNGTYQLIDGHLRAATTPDQDVPVLILDLNDSETEKLLTLLDPLSALAESNSELLNELIENIETESAAIKELLQSMSETELPDVELSDDVPIKETKVPELFQILVQCSGEEEQETLYEKLTSDGYQCRILNL